MQSTSQFQTIFQNISQNKGRFFGTFFVVVFVTYAFLVMIDFIPEPIEEEAAVMTEEVATEVDEAALGVVAEETALPVAATPTSIYIEKLDREITVLNPNTNDIPTLDTALLSGVVRHPDSADFTEPGNIFILGHSSYLPNVLNRNFQAFNGIQDLTWGDKIYLESADAEYVYRVNKVYQAKASEVVVPATPGEARLTLATCNSFGSKDDRYIVEAVLIDTKVATR